MSKSDTTFNSISEAIAYLFDELSSSGLSKEDKEEILRIQREINYQLPAIQYALDLFYDEPKLVTGKRALTIACGKLYAYVCEIDAIRNYGNSREHYTPENALTNLNVFRAVNYLHHQLTRAHRNLCSGRYR